MNAVKNIAELESRSPTSGINAFYITFSDLVVLLCVFFVMMLAMSKVDTGSFERVKTGFSGNTAGTLVELSEKLQKIASGPPQVGGVTVQLADDGVRLDLESAALFETGSAVLKRGALQPFSELFREVLKTQYTIDVEGHADDQALFKKDGDEIVTNWSLSGHRASTVVFFLEQFGFKQSRLRIVGYSSNKPKVAIQRKRGSDLDKARAENRRVSLLIR